MIVKKFGGTSVGKPERMHHVAQLINDGKKKVVVLSAVSGTTNSLVQICDSFLKLNDENASRLLNELHEKYKVFIEALYATEEAKSRALDLINDRFDYLSTFSSNSFADKEERIFLAQGEILSTHMMTFYLQEQGISAKLIHALEYMKTKEGEPDMDAIASGLNQLLNQNQDTQILITQGYICLNEFDEIDNLKRGGSDYTASIVGAAANAEVVEIWTDIDGMHNNDPRIVKTTHPVHEISFDEAAELAYFGAKILHPSSVIPAQKADIPVKLLNTLDPSALGTTITSKATPGLKAVAAKDGITAVKIKSGRMFLAYGFLKRVFEVFEKYKTPIDMITTSEVAVSLTIDSVEHLDAIKKELSNFGVVETDSEQSIICIVGQFIQTDTEIIAKVLDVLKNFPIRMISYGGSRNNISLLLPSDKKVDALRAINSGLFEESGE